MKKTSCIFGKWDFLALMLRNILYFLKKKLSLYFRKRKHRNGTFSYFRNKNPKKLFIFQEVTFLAQKTGKKKHSKQFLIIQKTELSSPELKKLFTFQEEFSEPQKNKIYYISPKKVMKNIFQKTFWIIVSIFSVN